jgi:L-alanine-DL-glutamate epimerase-like enolase superfamily enzyme
MGEQTSSDWKREAKDRLRHDLARTPPANRRRFLVRAASSLAAGAAGNEALLAYQEKAPAKLKITDVKTTILRVNHRDWTSLVEVFTNEGIVGLGQTTFRVQPKVVNSSIDNVLKPMLIGRSPFEYETLWMNMFINNTKYGMAGTHILAISAVDIALWDLMGKAVDQPVYRLLGGKFRDKVEVYASKSEVRKGNSTPKAIAEQLARDVVPAGFRALKTHTHPGQNATTSFDARMGVDTTVEEITELRKLVGPKFKIMADVTNAYTPPQAIKVGRQLQELGTFFMEEPVAVFDYRGLAKVADALDMRIAAGEQQFTRWEFYRLITEGHVDIIQPNVAICGGITEMRKIAAVASIFDTSIVSHNTLNGIPTTAAVHFWVSTHNVRYPQEYDFNVSRQDFGNLLVKGASVAKDGFVQPSDRPGLGVELDRATVSRLAAL